MDNNAHFYDSRVIFRDANQSATYFQSIINQSIKTFARAPVTDDHWRRTSNPIKSIKPVMSRSTK